MHANVLISITKRVQGGISLQSAGTASLSGLVAKPQPSIRSRATHSLRKTDTCSTEGTFSDAAELCGIALEKILFSCNKMMFFFV